MRKLILAGCAALLLAACQEQPATRDDRGSAPAASVSIALAGTNIQPMPSPVPFRCPPAGMSVAYDIGITIQHRGQSRSNPMRCTASLSPNDSTLFFGEVGYGGTLERLWPLEQGKIVTHTFDVPIGGRVERFTDEWRVVGIDRIRVAGAERAAYVLVLTRSVNTGFLGSFAYWYDVETSALLRAKHVVERGQTPFRDREANSISRR